MSDQPVLAMRQHGLCVLGTPITGEEILMARFFASLRVRLILLVLLAILPAVLLTLYTASEDRQREAMEAQSEALRLAQVISAQEEELITTTRQLLVGISHSSDVRSGDPALCSAFLNHLLQDHFRRYANLGVASHLIVDINTIVQ